MWQLVSDFFRLLRSKFSEHQGPQNAASLTYTTLLSLVPLFTVVFAVLSALPIGDKAAELIQEFIFENFVPTAGEAVQAYLLEFSDKASRLTGVGFVFLVVVALMLMASIDQALNTIWEVRKKRRFLNKFLVYWVTLSLGPVAIVASLIATSYLVTLPMVTEVTRTGLGQQLLSLMPIGFSAVGFTLMYLLVPNRRIKFLFAVLGGVLAAFLFELAKLGFAAYFTRFNTYEIIYGALAAIPIFLIWVYLVWLIILIGAEFTHCLEIFKRYGREQREVSNRFAEMVEVLLEIGQRQQHHGASSVRQLSRGHVNIEGLLSALADRELVYETDSGRWVLARSVADITLADVYHAFNYRLPVAGEDGWPQLDSLAKAFGKTNAEIQDSLDITLDKLRS